MICPECGQGCAERECERCGWHAPATIHRLHTYTSPPPVPLSPEECAYREFRVRLMRRAMGTGLEGFARLHVEGLSAWLADPGHLRWAQATPMGDCRRHAGPHTQAQCLRDEIGYWTLRAEGVSEAEAYNKLHVEVS